jgi:hypothetical protein
MDTRVLSTDGEGDTLEITVSYDGPELAGGRMDMRYLAPAMLATAKLFEHTAQEMYGSAAALKIDVQADFQRGSFTYHVLTQRHRLVNRLLITSVLVM